MANYLASDTDLTAVANAIRTKGGTSAALEFPDEFVSAIGAIPSGSSSAPMKDVNFIDYDGTIVYSYTAQEFAALSAMPDNPTHDGLTAQGWNWSLSDAKTYVATYGKLWIDQMYVTTSGDTEIDIELHAPRLTPYLGIAVNGTAEVDWEDGTAKDTVTGTSLTTQILTPHTYASEGGHAIKIHVVSGSVAFYGSSIYPLLSGGFGSSNKNKVYANAVLSVRIGSGVTSIGSSAFYNCYSLASVSIPSNVTSIGSSAFYSCYSLASVSIPSSVTSIGEAAFSGCCNLASVSIPSSVTSINNQAFSGCYSLASVSIPSSVTSIGEAAFYNCYSLASVSIPSNVTSIGSNAFNNFYGLGLICLNPSTPPTVSNSNALGNIPTDCTIYVPFTSLAAYLIATNYPAPATYTYIGFATYAAGANLPTQDSTQAYNVTWYATQADALAQTNAITVGNGNEIYCRYVAV